MGTAPATSGRNWTIGIAAVILAGALGVYAGVKWHESLGGTLRIHSSVAPTGAASLPWAEKQLWTCGMHPQVIQDHPGTCPICHMELTPMEAQSPAATGGSAQAT